MTSPKYTVWEITSQTTSRCLTDSTKAPHFNCRFTTPANGFPQYVVFDDGGLFVATFRTLDGLRQHIPDALPPFKIDGPGKYVRRDGVIVQIFGRNPNLSNGDCCWYGVSGDSPNAMTWTLWGNYNGGPTRRYMDLVAKVED